MLIYWGFFLVLTTGSFLQREDPRRRIGPALIFLAAIPTALMIGLRWKVGPDWVGYTNIFDYTRLYSFDQVISHADPGFFTLNWAVHQLHAPFWTINAVCGVVFVAGLTFFCSRQPNPWLAYLVAFPYSVIVIAMSADRQSVAIGFMFFALVAYDRQQVGRFLILMLIGATFHSSMLLMIPLCLFPYTGTGLQKVVILSIVAVLGVYFFKDEFGVYARRYSVDRIKSSGVYYRLAMNTAAAVIYLVVQRRIGLTEHSRKLWKVFALATLCLLPIAVVAPSNTAVDRFLLYLFPLQYVVLSRVPGLFQGNVRGQYMLAVVSYTALVQCTFLFFGAYAQYYVPYQSILRG